MKMLLRLLVVASTFLATGYASATEVARAPWYAKGAFALSGDSFRFFFPQIGTNKRLDIQFMACNIAVDSTGDAGFPLLTFLGVNDALNSNNRRLPLVWHQRTVANIEVFEISDPIAFSVKAGERPQIGWHFAQGSFGLDPYCVLTGELVFLQ